MNPIYGYLSNQCQVIVFKSGKIRVFLSYKHLLVTIRSDIYEIKRHENLMYKATYAFEISGIREESEQGREVPAQQADRYL